MLGRQRDREERYEHRIQNGVWPEALSSLHDALQSGLTTVDPEHYRRSSMSQRCMPGPQPSTIPDTTTAPNPAKKGADR